LKKRGFRFNQSSTVLVLVLSIGFGPYVYSRWASTSRVCQSFETKTSVAHDGFETNELSLVIFNIAHGRGAVDSNFLEDGAVKKKRVDKIAHYLREIDADLVILNEVDFYSSWSGHQNQAEAIAHKAGYRYRGEQRNFDFRFLYGGLKFGNAILSRFPVLCVETFDFPNERSWEPILLGKKRGATFEVQISIDKRVGVVPVHLEHRSESVRVASVEMIVDSVRDGDLKTFIAGDFNSTPTGMPGSQLAAGNGNTIDRLDESNLFSRPSMANDKANFTFPSHDPRSTIDWIMAPFAFEFVEYRVLQTDLSDHLPVFARVRVPE